MNFQKTLQTTARILASGVITMSLQLIIAFSGVPSFLESSKTLAIVVNIALLLIIFTVVFIRIKKLHGAILRMIIGWALGFTLGIAYIAIFDPHEAQGIFLAILWTGPAGGLLGLLWPLFSRFKKAEAEKNYIKWF